MGIGIITNPIVVAFGLLIVLKEIGVWQSNLLVPAIAIILAYSILTYISTQQ